MTITSARWVGKSSRGCQTEAIGGHSRIKVLPLEEVGPASQVARKEGLPFLQFRLPFTVVSEAVADPNLRHFDQLGEVGLKNPSRTKSSAWSKASPNCMLNEMPGTETHDIKMINRTSLSHM
ncbi:hypothetical protein TWF132_004876 [Orbilia oligospora]|nr:hypothetical protein TWF132_004876 [Orbilia oligospora]